MSAIAKSSRVKGKLSGRLYFGVAGSLEGIDETVALLKFLFNLVSLLVSKCLFHRK